MSTHALTPAMESNDLANSDKSPDQSINLQYRPELDGIRAIAVTVVMLGHISIVGRGADLAHPAVFPGLVTGGLYGVDMFFVLSGFLITSLLRQEYLISGRISVGHFYARRALRLLPPLAVVVVFSSLYCLLASRPGSPFGLWQVAAAAFYVSNFVAIAFPNSLGMLTHTWSLAVEEQFYSVWPWVVPFLLRLRPAVITVGLAALVIGSATLRFIASSSGNPLFAMWFPLAHADGLLIGALVAISPIASPLVARFLRWGGAIVLTAILAFAPGVGNTPFNWGYLLSACATGALIAGMNNPSPNLIRSFLSLPPLRFVGRISYGLYLYHLPTYALMPFPPSPLTACLALALSYGIAIVSFYFIEAPALRQRFRFAPAHKAAAVLQ